MDGEKQAKIEPETQACMLAERLLNCAFGGNPTQDYSCSTVNFVLVAEPKFSAGVDKD
jgi:hypothetical protein